MPDLKQQLNRLGRLLRLLAAVRALLWWLLVAGLLAALLAVAARLAAPVWTLPAVLCLLGLALLGLLGVTLGTRWPRRQVAQLIDRHDLARRELVLAAAELAEAPPAQFHFSAALTATLLTQASQAVAALPRDELLQTRRLRPLALAAALALTLGLSLTLLNRDSLAAMLQVTTETPAVRQMARTLALPAPAPLLSGVTLRLDPPAYTALPARTLTGDLRQVNVPSGSTVTLSALNPVSGTLSLQVGKSAGKLLREGNRVRYAFTPAVSTTWLLAVSAGNNSVVRQGRLRLIADRPPTVRVTYPNRNLTLETLKPLKLSAVATDDYGLTELTLEYLAPGQQQWQRVALGASGNVQRVEYEWDLSPLNLQGGQSVRYRFLARDNNLLGGPRTGLSRTYTVTLADLRPHEAQQRLEQSQAQQTQALEKLRAQAQETQEQLQALREGMGGGEAQELTPQQRAEMQQAADQLQKQAEAVRQAVAQTRQDLQQFGQSMQDLTRRLEEVTRLLEETLNKELKQAIERLREAARAAQPEQVQMSLEQAQQAQAQLMQRLDQMLALLQQAKLEGALAALRQEVQQLLERQQQLIEQREGRGDPDQQARDQRALGRDTERLPQKLDRLAQEQSEQAAATAEKLQQIAQQLRLSDPSGKMWQASRALRSGQSDQAAAPQRQALQALQQAADQLSEAQADIYSQMRQELQQASAELVRSVLWLSRQQEDLGEDTRPYEQFLPEELLQTKPILQRLARRQEAITAGSASVAQRLLELAQKSPLVDPSLALQAAGVGQSSEQAERDLSGGQMSGALQSQESVTIGLNQLAEALLKSDRQFRQASAQSAMQEYLKRLEQMAGQQRGLNQRTQQQGGGSPQPLPGGMQPGQRPGQGQGGALADEQAALRKAMQQLLRQAGNQGGLSDQLGGVPAEMDDVEQDLRGENITRETHRRQTDILHKMLDAQRSLYQKDREERQRKAEAPKPYKPPVSPPALRPSLTPQSTPPLLNPPRQDLPLGYEDLTRKYLEALSR